MPAPPVGALPPGGGEKIDDSHSGLPEIEEIDASANCGVCDSPSLKRTRGQLNAEKIEFNNVLFEYLVEQVNHERANSADLSDQLKSMEREMKKLKTTIVNLNELIKDLQNEKKELKELYSKRIYQQNY